MSSEVEQRALPEGVSDAFGVDEAMGVVGLSVFGPPGLGAPQDGFFFVLMNVRLAVRRAIGLHDDGQLLAAVEADRAILARHPGVCACWSNPGMALRELGRKDVGRSAAGTAKGVRVCPELAELNYDLGTPWRTRATSKGPRRAIAAVAREPGHLKTARDRVRQRRRGDGAKECKPCPSQRTQDPRWLSPAPARVAPGLLHPLS